MAADVTFVNNTKVILYMRVFDDSCDQPLKMSFSLNPSESSKPITPSRNSLCYRASRSPNPNLPPLYCGTATAPQTVTFDAGTQLCSKTGSHGQTQSKTGSQGSRTLRNTSQRSGGGGLVYIDDDVHLQKRLA
jgi:hypothetical protein